MDQLLPDAVSFEESVLSAIDESGRPRPNPRQSTQQIDNAFIQQAKRVRSIQRMPLPKGWSALRLSKRYSKWINRYTFGVIRERRDENGVLRLSFIRRRWVLLELTPTPFSLDCEYRRAYYITGGFLARDIQPPGRFELRIFPEINCLIAAIHGFRPRLPWFLYSFTQAFIHLSVMKAYARYLGKRAKKM